MSDQSHRLFGPIGVAIGLGVYAAAVLGGSSPDDPARWFLIALGADIALAGLWIAGLDRLFPGAKFEETLFGGILVAMGIFPIMGALPPLNPVTPLAGRVALALVGLPLVVLGIALTGTLARIEQQLHARGVQSSWLLGGLTFASCALALVALAVLLAQQGEGQAAAVAAIGVTGLVIGGLVGRLAFVIDDAWRQVTVKLIWAIVASAFAAAITAIAVTSEVKAALVAVPFWAVAAFVSRDLYRAGRRASQPLPPPPSSPSEQPGPMQAIAPRTDA